VSDARRVQLGERGSRASGEHVQPGGRQWPVPADRCGEGQAIDVVPGQPGYAALHPGRQDPGQVRGGDRHPADGLGVADDQRSRVWVGVERQAEALNHDNLAVAILGQVDDAEQAEAKHAERRVAAHAFWACCRALDDCLHAVLLGVNAA